jgi:hypothetical protein
VSAAEGVGPRRRERPDRTPRWALVARYGRGRRLRAISLTADGVEVDTRRACLAIAWGHVLAVRSHGPEHADGRPRRLALDVVDVPVSPLLEHLTVGPADRPDGVRTLVLPTGGLDTDPALLLAALDHYVELPGQRTGLSGHDWSAGAPPTG